MKISKYNFISESKDGGRIAYNALTGALAKMTDEYYQEYRLIEQCQETLSTQDAENKKRIYSGLMQGGYILPDNAIDEMRVLEQSFLKNKYDNRNLNLTIAPTMDCNFDCYYCYEKQPHVRKNYMTDETVTQLAKFADAAMKKRKHLHVTWYGGEPLLAMDIIEKLSVSFIETAARFNAGYEAHIVTNGYYLTAENLERLLKNKITSAQVTLEGPLHIHDKRRFDRNSGSSFRKIINNIRHAGKFIKIVIRVNLDNGNVDSFEELIDFLEQESIISENVGLDISNVQDCGQEMDSQHEGMIMAQSEYIRKEKDIITNAVTQKNRTWVGSYPSPLPLSCGALKMSTFSIDPDGFVYKCWELLGDRKEAIYHISNPGKLSHSELQWLECDPKKDEECRNCKHLPICNGGCPLYFLRGRKRCTFWKDNLQEMLTVLAHKYEQIRKNTLPKEAL